MDLKRLIRAARAQNAETVNLWVRGIGGHVFLGQWAVTPTTLRVKTLPGTAETFGAFRKRFDSETGYAHDWADLRFQVKTRRNALRLMGHARTTPTMA